MFGYASDETPELMPLTHVLASRLAQQLAAVRKDGTCPWVRPDGKTQVRACGVAWCGVAWRGVAWRGVAWRGVAWRGVAWRGVAWRGVRVVWCACVWHVSGGTCTGRPVRRSEGHMNDVPWCLALLLTP
jgi:hypothetical protein